MEISTNQVLLRIDETLIGILKVLLTEQVKEIRSDAILSKIYDMTGTGKSISEIAKKANVSTGKVSGIWKTWEDAGLIVRSGKSFRKTTDRSDTDQ